MSSDHRIPVFHDPHQNRVQGCRAAGIFRRNDESKPLPAYTGAVVASEPCDLIARNDRQCCWPISDSFPWTFCGAPSKPESHYCPTHHRRAYKAEPTPEQRAHMVRMRAAKGDFPNWGPVTASQSWEPNGEQLTTFGLKVLL